MRMHRFQLGDRLRTFPGATWNRLVDAAEKTERQSDRYGLRGFQRDELRILALNNTSVDLEEGGVAAFNVYELNDRDECVLRADRPTSGSGWTAHIGIAAEDIAVGEIGWFVIGGICRAHVDITNTSVKFADIVPDDATTLTSHPAGRVRLLTAATQTGEQDLWVEVNSRAPTVWRAKPKGNVEAGGDGDVDILNYSGEAIAVVNVKLDWMDGNQGISQGVECLVMWFEQEGFWRFIAADCEEQENPNNATWPNGDPWTWPDTTQMTWV